MTPQQRAEPRETGPTDAGAVTHPRVTGRRARGRTAWWAKAWARAVEEAVYSERDLRDGRSSARAGLVGRITVRPGGFVAAVQLRADDPDEVCTVSGVVPVLGDEGRQALVETVAAESGRLAALLAGDLPHTLVEHAEEAGVELLPFGGELVTECTCRAWTDPCPHAVAVLVQLGWLVEADPFVLLHLRGMSREELLALLHSRVRTPAEPAAPERPHHAPPPDPDVAVDLDAAVDAALRAARMLEGLEED